MSAGLAQLQRTFLAAMQGGAVEALRSQLMPGRHADAATGISIYRNAYHARLREALESDHPVLGAYLGDALWARLCEGYVTEHPSTVRSLRHFGDSLPAYLQRAGDFVATPQCAELARLERRLLDCFDAPDGARAEWGALLSAPESAWPGLRLRFHPRAQDFFADWNSVEIWRALKDEQTPPQPAPARNRHWVLWRDDELVTRFRSLDTEESAAFSHFLDGGDFAGLCDRLLSWRPAEETPAAALGLLNRWCGEGWIGQWQIGSDRSIHDRP